MRIALISEKYPPHIGGLAISVARLARLLFQAGHVVHIFTLSSDLEPGRRLDVHQDGPTLHRLGAHRRMEDTLADWFDYLVALHNQVKFDLLHAYYITQAGFVGVYAANFLGLPCVVSARGNDLDRAVFDPQKNSLARFALDHASAVTANTQELVRKARALSSRRTVYYVPNGVDSQLFQALPRQRTLAEALNLSDQAVIAFVGEARAKKGLAALLLAYRLLYEKHPACLLLVGGVRPGEDQELLNVFRKQNPHLPLHITPFLPQESLPPYYSLMDVLVIPSIRDGLPNALLEGMACERAIVATPVGGMLDVIQDGHNGIFAPSASPEDLAGSISQLLDQPERRIQLGQHARSTVLSEFTLERELEGYLAIYRDFVNPGANTES